MQTPVVIPAGGGLIVGGNVRRYLRFHVPPKLRQVDQRRMCIMAAVTKKQAEAIQYRKLGDSDLVISEVTLGTMTWGNQNTEKEAHEQLAYAFDQGINMLDTAEVYPVPMSKETLGRTDRIIAGWLKSVPRDKVVVATKVVGSSPHLTYLRDSGDIPRVDRKNIKESVEKSLKRLQVDHIDLLQIHWPDRYVPIFGGYIYDKNKERDSIPFEEQLQGFQEVIQEGKVRYIGVSNETSYGVMEFLHAAKTLGLPKIVSIQNNYNLLVRVGFEVNLIEVCTPRNGNVGLLAFSPLASGALTGKYLDQSSDEAKKGRLSLYPGFTSRYNSSLSRDATEAYVKIAKCHGITPGQLGLAFCRDREFMTSTIIGATTMEQLKENISAFQLPRPLSEEINDEIETVFQKFRDPAVF